MRLSANKTAQFFIQHEYYQIELRSEHLILSSTMSEEHIPFNRWNGKVRVKRGIFWASLQLFAHADSEQGKEHSWLVQGLAWAECRQFAHHIVMEYQNWRDLQYYELAESVPIWEKNLDELIQRPEYLPYSAIKMWVTEVNLELKKIGLSQKEAHRYLPESMEAIKPWLVNTSTQVNLRNQRWLETELPRWKKLFSEIESSPLNSSQQHAVLLNDNHNLILAGAGSGKTSVLSIKVAYLLQSQLANPNEILMVAFGKEAVDEIKTRLNKTVGAEVCSVRVNTFHQLGLHIINHVESQPVKLSPLALESGAKHQWCVDWLKSHWAVPINFKRWQKHLSQWPIAHINGDEELGSYVENAKLITWLSTQLDQLAMLGTTKKDIQQRLVERDDYSRLNSELSLCWPCYQAWQQTLKEQNQIDFNMMISRARNHVEKGKFNPQWKYILVDEYQDISPQRLGLLEALCQSHQETTQSCHLFAVGDDWQSIYQFAGSDLDLTIGFKKRFPYATIHHLDTTYRFNEQIGSVANKFIQANPNQLPKTLNSINRDDGHGDANKSLNGVSITSYLHIEKILDRLNRRLKKSTVLLLGRNHYHKPHQLEKWQNNYSYIRIDFMTCHASKGKEADYVIILNVDEGQFPAREKIKHLDSILKQSSDDFPDAEERRLFYVAMTRAKEKVWITHNEQIPQNKQKAKNKLKVKNKSVLKNRQQIEKGSNFVRELLSGDYAVEEQT